MTDTNKQVPPEMATRYKGNATIQRVGVDGWRIKAGEMEFVGATAQKMAEHFAFTMLELSALREANAEQQEDAAKEATTAFHGDCIHCADKDAKIVELANERDAALAENGRMREAMVAFNSAVDRLSTHENDLKARLVGALALAPDPLAEIDRQLAQPQPKSADNPKPTLTEKP